MGNDRILRCTPDGAVALVTIEALRRLLVILAPTGMASL